MRSYLLGLGLAASTCLVLWPLAPELARGVVSHLLTLIGSVYVGFALAAPTRMSIARQVAGCAFFMGLALAGLWLSWWCLVAGLVLHGAWDLVHHREHEHGTMPRWYVPACASYDWAVAAFIAWRFA
jgi:hypothetical protein